MPTETWLKHCISSVLCGSKFLCGAIFHIFVGMHKNVNHQNFSEWAFDLKMALYCYSRPWRKTSVDLWLQLALLATPIYVSEADNIFVTRFNTTTILSSQCQPVCHKKLSCYVKWSAVKAVCVGTTSLTCVYLSFLTTWCHGSSLSTSQVFPSPQLLSCISHDWIWGEHLGIEVIILIGVLSYFEIVLQFPLTSCVCSVAAGISLTWVLVSKLPAHHCSISGVPTTASITHSSPYPIATHLHSPLISVCSTNQTNVIIAKTLGLDCKFC